MCRPSRSAEEHASNTTLLGLILRDTRRVESRRGGAGAVIGVGIEGYRIGGGIYISRIDGGGGGVSGRGESRTGSSYSTTRSIAHLGGEDILLYLPEQLEHDRREEPDLPWACSSQPPNRPLLPTSLRTNLARDPLLSFTKTFNFLSLCAT